eukprot:11637912-Alexandrium_andersonii.AAC.1
MARGPRRGVGVCARSGDATPLSMGVEHIERVLCLQHQATLSQQLREPPERGRGHHLSRGRAE